MSDHSEFQIVKRKRTRISAEYIWIVFLFSISHIPCTIRLCFNIKTAMETEQNGNEKSDHMHRQGWYTDP